MKKSLDIDDITTNKLEQQITYVPDGAHSIAASKKSKNRKFMQYSNLPVNAFAKEDMENILKNWKKVFLPIHNIHGWNVDLILKKILWLVSDWIHISNIIKHKIQHKLYWLPKQSLEWWKVCSHNQAITQCKEQISSHNLLTEDRCSTTDWIENIKEWEFFILDKESGEQHLLHCYDENFWPEENYTYFAEMSLNDEIWDKLDMAGLDIWCITVDDKKWALFMQLLSLELAWVDLRQITSSLNTQEWTASIWVIMDQWMIEKVNKWIEKIISSENDEIKFEKNIYIDSLTRLFRKKISLLLWDEHDISINVKDKKITTTNKQGTLFEIQKLLYTKNINLLSIISKVNKWIKKIILAENDEIKFEKKITTTNKQGALLEILALLYAKNINLLSIISKVNNNDPSKIDFMIETRNNISSLEGEIKLTKKEREEIIEHITNNYKESIKELTCINPTSKNIQK